MADPVLHIKDSYYFEVPKVLCPSNFRRKEQFPDVWIKLDPDFQKWEFERQYAELEDIGVALPPKNEALQDWQSWVHSDHANFAKPFDRFLESKYDKHVTAYETWRKHELDAARYAKDDAAIERAEKLTLEDYLQSDAAVETAYAQFSRLRHTEDFQEKWEQAKERAGDIRGEHGYVRTTPDWSEQKIAAYNGHLSGKILIPQPFGELRNLYEAESGFAISKYMLIEVAIGLIILLVFQSLARKVASGGPPRGYLWNLMESFLLFIRDDIVKPSIGGGHHEEHHDHKHDHKHEHPEHGHEKGDPYAQHGRPHDAHGHADHAHHAHVSAAPPPSDVTRLLPLFWTIFFFVLGCNLFGMLPWLGAPSASFSVTTGLALVTLVVGMLCGIQKFGLIGYLGNQIPSMDLPWYIAIVVKPLVYAIEVAGMMIKHGVLAIRLLANMVAGHLVILGIMGVAFGGTAALAFSDPHTPSWQWPIAAIIAVVASALFSLLELFVAFLQAYIFTFLSALFIGAAIHKH